MRVLGWQNVLVVFFVRARERTNAGVGAQSTVWAPDGRLLPIHPVHVHESTARLLKTTTQTLHGTLTSPRHDLGHPERTAALTLRPASRGRWCARATARVRASN